MKEAEQRSKMTMAEGTSTFYTITPERAMSPNQSAGRSQRMTESEEGIAGPYKCLPSPQVASGEDIDCDIMPQFPPSPVAFAVNAAAGDLDKLPPLPETPLEFSQFEFGNRASFNSSVRDLIQEDPDMPIGGQVAAPMKKRFFNVGNLAGHSRDSSDTPSFEFMSPPRRISQGHDDGCRPADTPCIKIIPPSQPGSGNFEKERTIGSPFTQASKSTAPSGRHGGEKRPLISHSNFSDPFQKRFGKRSKLLGTPESESSLRMVIAPESPRTGAGSEHSNFSHDGAGAGNIVGNDFGTQLDPCAAFEAGTSPTSNVPTKTFDPRMATNNLDGLTGADAVGEGLKVSGVPKVKGVPGAPDLGGGLPIPLDATGGLTAPMTPAPRKRSKVMKRGSKIAQKGRKIVLRKGVLTIILGRQLAGPTSQALKLIGKGVPIDPAEVAGTLPAPVPVPA